MRPIRPTDIAFNDIKIAITSDIVHKYLLSNARDIQAIAALARLCNTYSPELFAWAASIAHAMVNPCVIATLSELIKKHNGNQEFIFSEMLSPEMKERWNTAEFHTEMKAVSSDYQKHGGYQFGNIQAGIAAEIISAQFKDRLNALSAVVSDWLNKKTTVKEDDLIQAIFNLKIPGMCDDLNGYWLLHFCRWISFVRNTVLQLPIIESQRYLDMIGVRLFRDHYGLTAEQTQTVFLRTCDFVAQVEKNNGRPDPKMTYGDFGCLACETHRVLDQLSKELKCNEDGARGVLCENLAAADQVSSWLAYKFSHADPKKGPSIFDSARYNASLFAQAYREGFFSRKRSAGYVEKSDTEEPAFKMARQQ